MTRTDSEYLVGLNLIPGLSPRRLITLLDHFSSPEEIWLASVKEISSLPGFHGVAEEVASGRSEEKLDRELELARKLDLSITTVIDQDYPISLREIEVPPTVLYMKGRKRIDTTRTIAIVGTRRSSGYGRAIGKRLARELGAMGLVVVSGLAVGIDTAAHRGALEAQAHTVAVLGSGFKHMYPAANVSLAERIGETGTIVSEYPVDTKPAKWTFPQRNRILSGLSRGVVVVEAGVRSGALITARFALEQGREVLAVPGNLTSTSSVGSNRLIKDGAKLVETVDDVVQEFPDLCRLNEKSLVKKGNRISLSEAQQRVYDLVGVEAMHIDDIIDRGNLSLSEASYSLLALQMENLIQEVEGRRYIRIR